MAVQAVYQSAEIARLAVDVASDKQASEIVMLDVRGVSDFADFFVILTAESSRQMSSLTNDLEDALEARGASLHHREGTPEGGWVLLDFVDVIVHLFRPEEREFYSIEGAWPKGKETVRVQ